MRNPGKGDTRWLRTARYSLRFSAVFLCLYVSQALASDCRILDMLFFEKQQDVIVTDWYYGYPSMRLTTETYPCADIRVQNTFWQALKSKDIEVTATFADGSASAKKPICEDILLEPGQGLSCSVCFESEFPISRMECGFR